MLDLHYCLSLMCFICGVLNFVCCLLYLDVRIRELGRNGS